MTVSPGESITYTLTVKNSGKKKSVTITDLIPANTVYVSGDGEVSEDNISFKISVAKGEEKKVSYTVKVSENAAEIEGGVIVATEAKLGKLTATCGNVYVGETFNENDLIRMSAGINAISYSENRLPVTILKQMYNVAFSKTPEIRGEFINVLDAVFETEMVTIPGEYYREMSVPALFGGSAVDTANLKEGFKGVSAYPREGDFLVGDIFIVEGSAGVSAYIYDIGGFVTLDNSASYVSESDVISLAKGAKRYAALRPSLAMHDLLRTASLDIEGLSEAQRALVATAKAYLLRGYRLQYDSTRLPNTYITTSDRGEYRWQIGQYNPEDYTTQNWGYIHCAGFTYDVYRTALGVDLGNLFLTKHLIAHFEGGGEVNEKYPYYYNPSVKITEEEKRAIENDFISSLEVGDMILVRRSNDTGHVMLYIGNDTVIHSTGSDYQYDSSSETYEPTIRYMNIRSYLFDSDSSNYLFDMDGHMEHLAVIRPLSEYNIEQTPIPENTKNRVNNLGMILSEKLSSHPDGQTVNVGDNVTFTFKIRNFSNEERTLSVVENIGANCTLVMAEGAEVSGTKLTWSVTVAPRSTVSVSYTVKATGEEGSYIYSDSATIGGVLHTCPKVYIKGTLTNSEASAIKRAAEKFKNSNPDGYGGIALVNAIYKEAGLDLPFTNANGESLTLSEVGASIFADAFAGTDKKSVWTLNTSGEYHGMLVGGLYGGRRMFTTQGYTPTEKICSDRARLVREQSLDIGDIIVVKFSDSTALYMYVGTDKLLNLSSSTIKEDSYDIDDRLARLIAVGNYFAVLRPSQMIKK